MAVSPRYEPGETIEELFRAHGAKVQLICRSMLADSGEAEDAAQQVFLAAFRSLAGGTVPRRPEAWLAAIARNECRGRAQSRLPVAATNEEVESPIADPSAQVVKRAEVAAVWEAIGELPPTQREALLLREVRGLSYKELADDLQLTRPSIRSLLTRARQAIRARLGDGWAGLGGASWLESLSRLTAGGSTPAAIATKTAAVGLGAAAITGGAAVAPELTPHPRPHREAVAIVHARRAVAADDRPKPADPLHRDPVEAVPSPPARAVAVHLVAATRVVQHSRRELEPSVRRVHHRSVVPSRPSPSVATPSTATFVSDREGVQQSAPQPAPVSTPAPSTPVTQGARADGESDHGSGSPPPLATASPAPTVATPPVEAEALVQAAPDDGERGTVPGSDGAFSPAGQLGSAPVSDGYVGSADGSRQYDGSDGSGGH
jgi:RNA polymerase sigma-70 factor (ECF subfamily)